jgi:hypothetical protein
LPQDFEDDRLGLSRRADQGCSHCSDQCTAHIHSLEKLDTRGLSRGR